MSDIHYLAVLSNKSGFVGHIGSSHSSLIDVDCCCRALRSSTTCYWWRRFLCTVSSRWWCSVAWMLRPITSTVTRSSSSSSLLWRSSRTLLLCGRPLSSASTDTSQSATRIRLSLITAYHIIARLKVKQMIYIAVLCNPKITAEPLYNTPIVHWTLCRCQQYGAFSMKALTRYQII